MQIPGTFWLINSLRLTQQLDIKSNKAQQI